MRPPGQPVRTGDASEVILTDQLAAFVLANCDHGTIIVNRLDFCPPDGSRDGYVGVGMQILETGNFDCSEVKLLKDFLILRRKHFGDGVVGLDCGANIGVHTLEWAKLMRGWGKVIAIEAQERIFYALAGNIALNNAFNARAIWAAVGNEDGFLEIPEPDYLRPGSFGCFEIKPTDNINQVGQPIDYDKKTLKVRALKIDALGLSRLDLLKIDVEGMELEALTGATETIQRCRPMMYVETLKGGYDPLKQFVERLDYRSVDSGFNMIAVPNER